MKNIFITFTVLILCLTFTTAALCADVDVLNFGGDSPVEINADSVEYLIEKNAYIITGNASLKSGDSVLTADRITVDTKTNKAHATGNAVITSPRETIKADELDINLKTRFGTIINGKIFVVSENFHITGESLERTGENTYVVKNGTFTTCDGDVPSWKFSARHLNIEIDGYVFAYSPVFYVRNIPTFYLPAIVFPIKKTRQSGLLFPTIGYSTQDGTIVKIPYYQVISDSMDATFTLDTRNNLGTGVDTEFRYVLSEGSYGQLDWYIMDEFAKDNNRWSVNYRHTELFSPTLSMKTDLKTVSDRDYFYDFGSGVDERNIEKLESNVTVTKNFSNASIQLEHSYDKDLVYNEPLGDLSSTNMQFPKLTARVYKTRIMNSPFNYYFDGVFNNFLQKRYDNVSFAKANPGLSADFPLSYYAIFTPYITTEHAKFWLHDDPARAHDQYDSYQLGATLSSKLSRVFGGSDTFKVRHIINPVIEYAYVPKVNVYEPHYTLAEIRPERNDVTLRLINRLTTRRDRDGQYQYSEPLRLEVAQTYDLYEADRDLNPLIPGDDNKPFRPLYVDADITAGEYLTLNGELYHDHYMKDHIRQYNVAMELKDKRNDRLKVSYTYRKELDNYLETYLNINLGYGVSVNNTVRYDYLANESQETIYGVELAMQCWGMSLKYSEERIEDPVDPVNNPGYIDKTVMLYFSLKGVGETKDITLGP